jgi:hypothetical protein
MSYCLADYTHSATGWQKCGFSAGGRCDRRQLAMAEMACQRVIKAVTILQGHGKIAQLCTVTDCLLLHHISGAPHCGHTALGFAGKTRPATRGLQPLVYC